MAGEPSGAMLSEARLETTTCKEMEARVQERTQARVRDMREQVDAEYRNWRNEQRECWRSIRPGAGGALAEIGSSGAAPSATHEPRAATLASGTNNQVAGVDEADLVKNDGRYVYLAANGALRIVSALEPRLLSVTPFSGLVKSLFVDRDRAVVYVARGGSGNQCSYGYDCALAGDGSATNIFVLDISNRSVPLIIKEFELSGSLIAARRVGHTVHTVVSDGDAPPSYDSWPDDLGRCGVPEKTVRVRLAKLKRDNEALIRSAAQSSVPSLKEQGVRRSLCNLLKTPISEGEAFTTVLSFDMADAAVPASTATIQSRPGAVYASASSLYFSVVQRRHADEDRWYTFYPSTREVSEVHKFHLGETPADTHYVGSGTVPGHVLNQFAMDEWYGYLRIATTSGRAPNPNTKSAVSILAQSNTGNLIRVGAVDGIAPGEDIRSVRFEDDRGYVVTFKKTDPLLVLDLYDPARPVELGELKIPGFSTYIQRLDPNHLLSIGFDANDHGGFAFFDGVVLQLFDVTLPSKPRLLFKEKLGTRGSSSEAAADHLAFNYFAETGRLAIPMTLCEGGGDGVRGTLSFSGLLVYDVSIGRGFQRLGGIDHGTKGANCDAWWSHATSLVKRSIFMDDLVYSIATDRMKVQRLGHFGQDVADIPLGAPQEPAAPAAERTARSEIKVVASAPAGFSAARKVAGMRAGMRACYLRALKEKPNASGVVNLSIKIGARGQVIGTSTTASGNLPQSALDCVKKRAAAATFDAPVGANEATVSAALTLILQ